MRLRSNKKIKDILFYLLGAFPKNTHVVGLVEAMKREDSSGCDMG
jgi:hypothetical protein